MDVTEVTQGVQDEAWRVGEVARRTGLSVRALHHYDQIGLVSPSRGHTSGHRWYSETDVVRLHTVVALRELGLSLPDIGAVLESGSVELGEVLAHQLAQLEEQSAHLRSLGKTVKRLIRANDDGYVTASMLFNSLKGMNAMNKHMTAEEYEKVVASRNDRATEDLNELNRKRRQTVEGKSPDQLRQMRTNRSEKTN